MVGGYVDNADNYTGTGSFSGVDGGDAPISGATSASYTTPTLTNPTDNGNQYQAVAYNAYGAYLSSAATATVNANPGISTATLPSGPLGASYSQTLAATGGASPYTWALASDGLPTGLSLSSDGRHIGHADGGPAPATSP